MDVSLFVQLFSMEWKAGHGPIVPGANRRIWATSQVVGFFCCSKMFVGSSFHAIFADSHQLNQSLGRSDPYDIAVQLGRRCPTWDWDRLLSLCCPMRVLSKWPGSLASFISVVRCCSCWKWLDPLVFVLANVRDHSAMLDMCSVGWRHGAELSMTRPHGHDVHSST